MNRVDKKTTIKPRLTLCNAIDSHKWETKMEIVRLISGKPDLKIEGLAQSASPASGVK